MVFKVLDSLEWSYLWRSNEVFLKRLNWARRILTSSRSLSRKACCRSLVMEEMMWSGGAGGLGVFFGGGVVPYS